jgi:SPP1 gp7 family putative phage head morphogenesis protein
MIAPQETAILTDSLISAADLSYYRTLYDYQVGTGLGFSFNGLSEEAVQRALDENWSGTSFSKRVWNNTNIVAAATKDIVQQNVMTGRSWRRCQQNLTGYVDTNNAGALFAAERLLRTETNHVHNEITAEAHQEMGVKKYRFLATLDSRTSLTCQRHDGNIDPDTKEDYTYENKKVGVNFPPLHPFCRSVINARLDPAIEARLVRRAKDPATGKISTVAYNMTYPEWFASLIPPKVSSTNMSAHAVQQAKKRGISKEAIDDAVQNPLSTGKVKYDDQGRKSVRVVGKTAEVAYNPDTGVIVSVNPTHSKKAKKLQEGKDGS